MKKVSDNALFCHPGTRISEEWIDVDDQVSLRVIKYDPEVPVRNHPIVFLSGLATVIDGFRHSLVELTRDFPVIYVDTREKSTARIRGKVEFHVGVMSRDLCSLVRIMQLEDRKYHLFGYSLGATVIVDSYRDLPSRPEYILLLEPNATFNYPKISLFLMRFNLPLLAVLKPLVKWYIWQFRINRKEDYEMYRISAHTLDRAHYFRLRKTALGISGYQIWDRLEYLTCPVLVIGTSKDHFHNHEEVEKMMDAIEVCTFIDLENNTRTHSPELGLVIRDYINKAIPEDGCLLSC
jgi:pimeloyl-ACP methyl ester carboxylesterase